MSTRYEKITTCEACGGESRVQVGNDAIRYVLTAAKLNPPVLIQAQRLKQPAYLQVCQACAHRAFPSLVDAPTEEP